MEVQKEYIKINHIPAIRWGKQSNKIIIAVHGNQSNKEDTVIQIFSEYAVRNGYQVISFDLPEHGERMNDNYRCVVWQCVSELKMVLTYAKTIGSSIGLFACSMGAFFGLLAYAKDDLEVAYFLSPVVDMRRMIENMMVAFQISKEQLKKVKEIATPIGQTLIWEYYQYVVQDPIMVWKTPTYILYGGKDQLCESDTIDAFVKQFGADLTIYEEGEHFFHSREQLDFFENWLQKQAIIRELREDEKGLIPEFLYEAIFQRVGEPIVSKDIIYQPDLRNYFEDFGRKGDYCLIAEVENMVVGAVWTRIWNGDLKGYAYIDDMTPELAISLYKEYRGKRIGTRLMKSMLTLLKREGYERISLSVQKDNYAFAMYKEVGFEIAKELEGEYLMVCNLSYYETELLH